ncbi:MAG: hypothetical protein M3Q06_09905 [Bacteroidota bacterium]|nr:hypothetical protein [Bacteroidota bacterium]
MPDNKLLFALVLFLLAGFTSFAQEEEFSSQPTKRAQYAWVVYAGGGPGYYVSNSGAPPYLTRKISNLSHVATFRLMWHPDHLLKVGLETGHLTFYSYRFRDSLNREGVVKLKAVPALIVWNMAVTKRLNLFAGSGVYFLRTNLDYRGKTESNKMSIGWMAAASYIHPLSATVGLGSEAKWMNASETSNGILSIQLQLVWKFLNW